MKMTNTRTKQFTTVKSDEFGWLEYQEAADRLVKRIMPGHFADSLQYYDLDTKERDVAEIKLEIIRGVGGMTERTGKYIYLEVTK